MNSHPSLRSPIIISSNKIWFCFTFQQVPNLHQFSRPVMYLISLICVLLISISICQAAGMKQEIPSSNRKKAPPSFEDSLQFDKLPPGIAKKFFPGRLFGSSPDKACNLPKRFAAAVLRVECSCCERLCNCKDIRQFIDSGDSRFDNYDKMLCSKDATTCDFAGNENICTSCDEPWYSTDEGSERRRTGGEIHCTLG